MSASLVGSEMCIRDRPSHCLVGPGLQFERPLGGHAPACLLRPQRQGASAVSYTHLTLPTICSV
eukprot:1602760-Alexandrium_andersonii.AAC.1